MRDVLQPHDLCDGLQHLIRFDVASCPYSSNDQDSIAAKEVNYPYNHKLGFTDGCRKIGLCCVFGLGVFNVRRPYPMSRLNH